MNKFKLYRHYSYTAYESYYRFVGKEYVNAIRWNSLCDLKNLFKLALSKPHKSDTFTSVVFYSSDGDVLTVFVDNKESFMNDGIHDLEKFLCERNFSWLTIPDILCLNRGSIIINNRFGQVVIVGRKIYDATFDRNTLDYKINTKREDCDGFNIVLPHSSEVYLESDKYSTLNTTSSFMYLYTYNIKEHSCLHHKTVDGWLTYRAKDLEFEVDVDESSLEFFWNKFRSLNCKNSNDVCSVNYAVIEENKKLLFTVMLTVHIDNLRRR